MSIQNVLASVAVKDSQAAVKWYEKLLGRPADSTPTPELAEWKFPRGGWLQVYRLPERAGSGSFTLAVDNLAAEIRKLDALGIDTRQQSGDAKVKTVMIADPDGNHIAFAQANDTTLAR